MNRRAWICAAAMVLTLAPVSADEIGVDLWRTADSSTRAAVLSLARRAFNSWVLRRETVAVPTVLPPLLRSKAAVFVSAMRNGAPRCCMGSLQPTESSAALEIVACADAAAGRDRRFPPIKPGELRQLTLIVSIVGPLRPITPVEAAGLDPARDGLAVRYGGRYGVVLSGETFTVERMMAWARIRAAAPPGASVQIFRLEDVRLIEGR